MKARTIRSAEDADLSAILAIYNNAIATSFAVWSEKPVDLGERRQWWCDRVSNGFLVIVADQDGACAGYASYGWFRSGVGYRFTRELSVYVDARYRGQGIASLLMEALEDKARANRVHVLVGGIEAGNTASLALYAKHGFAETARLPEIGFKHGRWLDLVLMQKVLS